MQKGKTSTKILMHFNCSQPSSRIRSARAACWVGEAEANTINERAWSVPPVDASPPQAGLHNAAGLVGQG